MVYRRIYYAKERAFIQRNNEIIQETPKTHSKLRCEVNTQFNTSFYGAQVWDLFSKASESLYNTWNVAIRKMFELPFRTHRYFIEAISERRNLKSSLLKREIKFANALRYNKKRTIKSVFSLLEEDTGSIIGKNLRKIMRLCGKSNMRDITYTYIDGMNYNNGRQERR